MKNNKVIINILAALPMIIIAIIIFGFSSQPRAESEETSDVILNLATKAINRQLDIDDVETQNQLRDVMAVIVRKTAHMVEFGVFSVSVFIFIVTLGSMPVVKQLLIAGATGVGYAITDEIHQLFVPGRAGLISDVIIDSVGIVVALVIVGLISRGIRHRKNQ